MRSLNAARANQKHTIHILNAKKLAKWDYISTVNVRSPWIAVIPSAQKQIKRMIPFYRFILGYFSNEC